MVSSDFSVACQITQQTVLIYVDLQINVFYPMSVIHFCRWRQKL